MPKSAKSLLIIATLVGCLLVGLSGSASGVAEPTVKKRPQAITAKQKKAKIKQLRQRIDESRRTTWRWQDKVLAARTSSSFNEKQAVGVGYLRWLDDLWNDRQAKAKRLALNPPHLKLWLCIHSGIRGGEWRSLTHLGGGTRVGYGEASWRDDGSPYWGGLQMGDWFHETYGGKLYRRLGTANNWEPIQQIWVAERAFKDAGYSARWLFRQWPNTAPPCASLLA